MQRRRYQPRTFGTRVFRKQPQKRLSRQACARVIGPAVEVRAFNDGGDWLDAVREQEVVIVPDGVNHTSNGDTLKMNAGAAKQVIAEFEDQGVDVVVDYEHASVDAKTGEKAPASGWIRKLRYEAGKGLIALIRWTAEAAELIATGAYRYVSPAGLVEKASKLFVDLHSVALTNKPAIKNFPALVG